MSIYFFFITQVECCLASHKGPWGFLIKGTWTNLSQTLSFKNWRISLNILGLFFQHSHMPDTGGDELPKEILVMWPEKPSSVKEWVMREFMAQELIQWITMPAPSLKITATPFPSALMRLWSGKTARKNLGKQRALCSLSIIEPHRYEHTIDIDWIIEAGFTYQYGKVLKVLNIPIKKTKLERNQDAT